MKADKMTWAGRIVSAVTLLPFVMSAFMKFSGKPEVAAGMEHLGIPPDQALVSGLALGYADPTKIENTLVSEREAVANVAHYYGFD